MPLTMRPTGGHSPVYAHRQDWTGLVELPKPRGLRRGDAVRVIQRLGAHPDPGPGDVDRAVRAALFGLWTPPTIEEHSRPARWDRDRPSFERISKGAA